MNIGKIFAYIKKNLYLCTRFGCIGVTHAHMRATRDEYTMSEVAIIQNKIYEVKGQKVMLDFELAELYGVETKALKRAVRRNIERFAGEDFMIILSPQEAEHLRSRYQNGTMNRTRGENIKYEQFAFTELGVAMLSSVLKSDTAIEINRNIMRAFVELRRITQLAATGYQELQREINDIKDYIEDILRDQNDINEEHGAQLEAISMALSELQMQKRKQKPIHPIGYNAPQYSEKD